MTRTELFFEKGDLHDLELHALEGREAISELYSFRVDVRSKSAMPPDELAQTLLSEEHRATLTLGTPEGRAQIHGMVSSVEALPAEDAARATFRVTVVPRLWLAAQTRRSRLYEKMTVLDILRFVLQHDYALEEGKDFVLRCAHRYAAEEYLVQYEESDWSFVCRILEYYGIYFWFRFDEASQRDVLTVADANAAFEQYAGDEGGTIPFNPGAKLGVRNAYIIGIARVSELRHPNHVLIHGYDFTRPKAAVVAERPSHSQAKTPSCFFWQDCETLPEAEFLARIRGEELDVWKTRYRAQSHVSNVRPGHRFSLDQHFDQSFSRRELVVTAIDHRAVQIGAGGESGGYSNSFEALDHEPIAFRPRRLTPWPRIDGVIPAKIAARPGMRNAGEMDRRGRYRVIVPYPSVHEGRLVPGRGSEMWIRMAQPNATQRNARGAAGFHMPLHGGTEVLLVHVNGDPDRPVIAGALPNDLAQSPIYDGVGTRGGLKTRSGITVQYDDDA